MKIITPSELMYKTLDSFFAEKTASDIDRTTYLVCNLEDKRYKLTFSLVFYRDADNLELDSHETVALTGTGAVFILPAYWLCIPKPLAMQYMRYMIDQFYETEVSLWLNQTDGSVDGGNGNNGGMTPGCGCGCPRV